MAKAKTTEKTGTKNTTKAGNKTKTETKQTAKSTAKQSTGKKAQTHADRLRIEIPELMATVDKSYLEAAEKLSEVWHKGYYSKPYGYEKFDHYCEAELPWKARSAKYLIDVFDKANLLNLPKERITKIGWTKMKEVVAILSKEMAEDVIDEWLTFAENNKTVDVISEVKKHRRRTRTSSSDNTGEGQMVWKLRMNESEANIITDGLNEAKALCDTTNDVVALEMIVQDWMEMKGNRPSRATVEDAIQYLENAYGIIVEGYRNRGEALDKGQKKDSSENSEESSEIDSMFDDSGSSENATEDSIPDPDDDDINKMLGLDE